MADDKGAAVAAVALKLSCLAHRAGAYSYRSEYISPRPVRQYVHDEDNSRGNTQRVC